MIGRIIDILNNPFYQLHFTTILDDIKPTPKLGEQSECHSTLFWRCFHVHTKTSLLMIICFLFDCLVVF